MNKLNLKRLKGKKLNFNGLNLKKLRKKKLNKKTLLIAGMNMLCLLLFLACLSRYTAYENLLTSQ
ncbi:MAG: hypothetical protein RRY35_03015, partial [Clostridiales bacterium]